MLQGKELPPKMSAIQFFQRKNPLRLAAKQVLAKGDLPGSTLSPILFTINRSDLQEILEEDDQKSHQVYADGIHINRSCYPSAINSKKKQGLNRELANIV